MNALVLMSLIVLVALYGVAGKQGLLTFAGLFLNLLLVLVLSWLILKGVNLTLSILIFGVLTLILNLYALNEGSRATNVSFIATLVMISAASLLFPLVLKPLVVHGFAPEELEELSIFGFNLWFNFRDISLLILVIAVIGAVMDVAISVTTGMSLLEKQQVILNPRELRRSGFVIGQDILTTTLSTLLFAFLGNYLAFILWALDLKYTPAQLFNSQVIVGQVVLFSLAGILIIATLSLAVYLYSWQAVRKN